MLEWLEYLKAGETILGMMVVLSGAVFSALMWWDRRARDHAKRQAAGWLSDLQAVTSKLDRLETGFESLEGDMTRLRDRVGQVEVRLGQLASREDVVRLGERVAGMEASTRAMSNQMDTIYRAMIAAARRETD